MGERGVGSTTTQLMCPLCDEMLEWRLATKYYLCRECELEITLQQWWSMMEARRSECGQP